jgi:hypothetical protein
MALFAKCLTGGRLMSAFAENVTCVDEICKTDGWHKFYMLVPLMKMLFYFGAMILNFHVLKRHVS